MSRTFIFILLILLPLTSRSQTVEVEGIVYEIDTTIDEAKVVNVTSHNFNEYPIQETVEYEGKRYPVTIIGYKAFDFLNNATSITIPNSVVTIEDEAFWSCYYLTSVTLSNSLKSIGRRAFYGCIGLFSISLPESLESIGVEAFGACRNLESLTIPRNVAKIGIPIFNTIVSQLSSIEVAPDNPKYDSRNGCNALIETSTNTLLLGCKNTIIPNNVTTIGKYAFRGIEDLKSLTLPNSVKEICDSAFLGTSYLRDLTLSDSLTFIGNAAFYHCAITTIKLPNSLRHIGDDAFADLLDPAKISRTLTLPDSMDYIGRGAFANLCITSPVVFPRNLKSIMSGTFQNCKWIPSITIPETVVSIEEFAFNNCYQLSEVKILGSSLQKIGYSAFKDCTGLTSINVPNSVKEIGDSAFLRCRGVSSINIPANLSEIHDGTFSHCSLESIIIPNSVKRIGKSAFAYCKLSTAKLPDGLESIEDSTFHTCKFSRIIPSTMAEEGGDSCLILPPSLKHIGKYAFADNRRLTSVILPNSLKTIGYMALSNYADRHRILKTVVIPAGVEEIGSGAFSHGDHYNYYSSLIDDLKDIYCHVVTPIDSYVFNNQSEKTLHVPAQSVGLYRNHVYWNQFKEIVPLTNEETGISPTTMRESDDGIHYSLSGSLISPESKGIHLVRYKDGTVRKVIGK